MTAFVCLPDVCLFLALCQRVILQAISKVPYTHGLCALSRWVRSIAFEPGNEWFCTGSADRTIKIWDLATGQLKLTLTGHIEQVTGLAVSRDHPYMFSCGLDKMVKCWDMEYNKVSHIESIVTPAM